ncbi:hypothetical protein OJF2_47130 [Aquisphaera giovannonii]|uniref:Peptidylprolyl isomerase n=1 Tax=Aquisphaera giovannonii TaxID=406548 RepID=A0A5B9W6B8_9BACT|nr:hypothetical protein [Aquisphaera giovannonii]QEH36153.1 hypothetical protein OJF2_47130 [Aquisphaera giovannonii]
MPFAVFRRHQKVLLVTFGILAMGAFVLSDSVPRLLSSNAATRDQKIVELHGKSVYQSQLNELARQRNRANLFVSGMIPYRGGMEFFGTLKQRDLVDALILQEEAERLGIPATPEMAREWLSQFALRSRTRMTNELFNALYARFSNDVSEEHLLSDIANQVRILKVRDLLGSPVVTPYDVFRTYREQNERVAAKLVEVPVDSFLGKVGEPSDADVRSLYDKYKDVLPDPASETPGFKVPREVQVEILSIDGDALARELRSKVGESDLRTYYENHKAEFPVPSEFPTNLFAGRPELTPPILQPFSSVREILAPTLAGDRAAQEIQDKFDRLKEDVMIPFVDKYLAAIDEQGEARKQGGTPASKSLPTPEDLKDVAAREGMTYEKTGMLTKEAAGQLGQVSTSEVGQKYQGGGHSFVDELFDPKAGLYEPIELVDYANRHYLVRKVKDEAPHVPALDQVRGEVVRAWKIAKARPLAEKAAEEIARKLGAAGGAIKDSKVEDYRVVTVPPITRSTSGLMPNSYFDPRPVESDIPGVPLVGPAFRNAYFSLRPGQVSVAPNEPKTVYYAMGLDRQEPAKFASLYAPNSDLFRYRQTAYMEAARSQDERWMNSLREKAGLKPDWVPPDEQKKDDSARG